MSVREGLRKVDAVAACKMFLLGCALYGLWLDARYLLSRIALPFQVDDGEGNLLNGAVRILQHQTLYPDPHHFPNALNPYGPVMYGAVALVVKGTSVQFLGPRLIVVASVVAVAALIVVLIRHQGGSWLTALAFGCLYPSLPIVQDWTPILRVDLPGLALTLAGLACFVAYPRRRYWAVFLFCTAILVKHTFLAAPAACFFFLLTSHQRKEALRFALAMTGFLAIGVLATELWSGGFFRAHLLLTHPDPWQWGRYVGYLQQVAIAHFVLLLLACAYVVAELRGKRLGVLGWYFFFALLISITGAKGGSNLNHFLELLAVLLLCGGLGLDLARDVRPRAVAVAFTAVVSALLALQILQAPPLHDRRPLDGCASAYAFVAAHQAVLSENTGALAVTHQPVFLENPFVYAQLVKHRGWTEGPIVAAVQAKGFDAIVLSGDLSAERFGPETLRAIGQNYVLVRQFSCVDAELGLEPRAGVRVP